MNWTRALLAGVVGGIVVNLADFVMHGMIMAGTYTRYPDVFAQEEGNPVWFFVVAISLGIVAALFYARTYSAWSPGAAGGAVFGFWVGLLWFFTNFYFPLVLEGFPYFLAWCWGGINLIDGAILGAVIGALYKQS